MKLIAFLLAGVAALAGVSLSRRLQHKKTGRIRVVPCPAFSFHPSSRKRLVETAHAELAHAQRRTPLVQAASYHPPSGARAVATHVRRR
jgi:hypothetical protein